MQIDITYTDLMTLFRGIKQLREEANSKTYANDAMIKTTINEEKKSIYLNCKRVIIKARNRLIMYTTN